MGEEAKREGAGHQAAARGWTSFTKSKAWKLPPEEREMDLLIPPPPDLGNVVVELEGAGVNVGSATSPRWLFRHLTLSLRPGQCTGIVGRNGVGKTTLLKRLPRPDRAERGQGRDRQAGEGEDYIDQTRMALDGTGSLLG